MQFSCKREGDPPAPYNGFKVDGVMYSLDTMERDFSQTAGALRVHSADHGGAMVYFRRGVLEWPSADGTYTYQVSHNAVDTTDIEFCFEPDGLFEQYCSMSGGSGISTTMTLTIKKGKWGISLPPTQIMDTRTKTIEISLSE